MDGNAARKSAREMFSNPGADSSSNPRRVSTSSNASSRLPDRICCCPSSIVQSSHASWDMGGKFGDKDGVRPLPRLNCSCARCNCADTSSARIW